MKEQVTDTYYLSITVDRSEKRWGWDGMAGRERR